MLATVSKPAAALQVQRTASLSNAYAHILLYGRTKAGKTSTAVTLEKDQSRNAIICTQPKEQLAHLGPDVSFLAVDNFKQLDEALRNIPKLFPEAGTVIVDDFTTAVEFARRNAELTTADGRQAYGKAAEWTSDILRTILAQPYNLILTAFERKADEETNSTEYIRPDFPRGAGSEVTAKMDFIIRVDGYKLTTKEDKTARVLAACRWPVAKLNLLPDKCEPNLGKLWATYLEALKG